MTVEEIRAKLKEIREKAGFSRAELSKLMGHSFPERAIQNIEDGNANIGINTIQKWCSFCSAQWTLVIEPYGTINKIIDVSIPQDLHLQWLKYKDNSAIKIREEYPELSFDDISADRIISFQDEGKEFVCFFGAHRISMKVSKEEWESYGDKL